MPELSTATATASRSVGASLIARFQGFRGAAVSQFRGYELEIRSNGAWQIVASGPAAATLASGSVTAAHAYTLSLTTRGTTCCREPSSTARHESASVVH